MCIRDRAGLVQHQHVDAGQSGAPPAGDGAGRDAGLGLQVLRGHRLGRGAGDDVATPVGAPPRRRAPGPRAGSRRGVPWCPRTRSAGDPPMPDSAVDSTGTGPEVAPDDLAWNQRDGDEVAAALGVDPGNGLRTDQVADQRVRFGPNRLPDAAREPVWRALLRPFQDLLVLVLIVAAAVSAAVSREWETPVVILLVVVLNAAINFVQERKAEASLQALRDMTVARCQVRRDGRLFKLDAADMVPGDAVVIEAGDRVPAGGRRLQVAALEVQDATLTGESEPVAKDTGTVADSDAPLADRIDMVFMNTVVTRGRAVFVVTATGTGTQMGAIAGLLAGAKSERTPLQRQINQLARTLTELAGAVVLVVFVLGLLRGQSFSALFLLDRSRHSGGRSSHPRGGPRSAPGERAGQAVAMAANSCAHWVSCRSAR